MWNHICGSNILDKRAKYKSYMRHMDALRSVRSTVDNSRPHKPVFLDAKEKPRLMELQRRQLIQASNNILVDRMQKTQPTIRNHNNLYYKVRAISQSRPYKKRQEKEIDIGNEMMIKKLQGIESDYNVHDILKNTDSYLTYKHNIMNSTKPASFIYNASMYSSTNRPFSSRSRPMSAPKRID